MITIITPTEAWKIENQRSCTVKNQDTCYYNADEFHLLGCCLAQKKTVRVFASSSSSNVAGFPRIGCFSSHKFKTKILTQAATIKDNSKKWAFCWKFLGKNDPVYFSFQENDTRVRLIPLSRGSFFTMLIMNGAIHDSMVVHSLQLTFYSFVLSSVFHGLVSVAEGWHFSCLAVLAWMKKMPSFSEMYGKEHISSRQRALKFVQNESSNRSSLDLSICKYFFVGSHRSSCHQFFWLKSQNCCQRIKMHGELILSFSPICFFSSNFEKKSLLTSESETKATATEKMFTGGSRLIRKWTIQIPRLFEVQ